LYSDNQALQSGQKVKRQGGTANGKNSRHHQGLWPELDPSKVHRKPQKVPDDQDRQIGWPVVSAVMVQLFAANGAAVGDLEIADEHMPFAAIGAPAAKATGHCLLCWALLFVRGG
jgi:hypothetical protein